MPLRKISCMKKSWNEKCMHENNISMHEHEKFVPGTIFPRQNFSWEIGLYTTPCIEFSSMKVLGNIFIFLQTNRWRNLYFHACNLSYGLGTYTNAELK